MDSFQVIPNGNKTDSPLRQVDVTLNNRRASDPSFVVFQQALILDCSGKDPYVGDVLIEKDRFKQVGGSVDIDKLKLSSTENVLVIDARGKTLMSGLIDCHTHMTWNDASTLDSLSELPVEEHMVHTVTSAKKYLDHGFTMCFGAASAKKRLDVVLRDSINSGLICGPRYLANGPEICTTGGAIIPGISLFADGADEMRKTVRELVDIGVDNIKLMMTGDGGHPTMAATQTYYTFPEVQTAVEEAHKWGKRVCAHARSAESVTLCAKAKVDVIYHASYVNEEGMDLLVKRKDEVFVGPAINFPYNSLTMAEPWGLTREMAIKRGLKKEVDAAIIAMKEMHRRGIRLLPGGDYGFAWSPHGTYARDIDHFVRLFNYSPMEAILSATKLGGELMGHPDELGMVKAGFYADCILVDTVNVLEDVRILQDTSKLVAIVINGHIHKLIS